MTGSDNTRELLIPSSYSGTDRDQPPLDAAETAPTGHPPLDAGGPPAGHYPRSLPGSAPHAAWMDPEEKRMWEIRGRPHLENRPPTT